MYESPNVIEQEMALGCFEVMAQGTRNAKRQMGRPPSGLCFNICSLETSYIPNSEVSDLEKRISQKISAELQYSCLHWADHLFSMIYECGSHSNKMETTMYLFEFFGLTRSLYWLEILSLLGRLGTARDILIRFLGQSNVLVSICT